MAYDFSELKKEIENTKDWLAGEFSGVRTGRAAPALLDGVKVEAYGAMMPLNQVGTVSVEDARTLRVNVWDASQVKAVEKAIADASLGVTVGAGEESVRVSFPELTAERREQLMKIIKDKLEDARVSIKTARDETWNDIQKQEKDGDLSEDEKFRYKDEMQKLVDEANKQLEEMAERKEKEIQG